MTEPICIMFGGSQEYRDHIYQRVMNQRTFGATAGDSFWMGYGTYDVVDNCLQFGDEEREPITCLGWRAKIDKAKRDIQKHKSEQRVQLLAEHISDGQILTEIEVIRQWANSLKRTQSQTGLLASMPAGMS